MAVIDLSIRDNISAGAQAAADALGRLADAADKVSTATTKVDQTTSAALPSFTSINNKLDEGAGLAAKVEAANRKYEASLASLRAEADRNADVAANLHTLETNAAADRDIAIQKATDYATRIRDQRAAVSELISTQTAAIQQTQTQSAAILAAATAQDTLNARLNVQSTSATSYASRAADIAAYGTELDRLRAKFDPLFAASRQYENTLNEIAAAQKVGAISATTAAAAVDRTTAAYASSNGVISKTTSATSDLEDGHKKVTTATHDASGASAGFTRELIVMGHEITQGNFSRLGGSMLVLTERSETLTNIVKSIASALLGWPGVFLAAGVGATILAVSSEHTQVALANLQNQLRATRDDYISMATEATSAAKAIAATSGVGTADAKSSAQIIVSAPNFHGTQTDLESLIKTANELSIVMGTTVPEAAKTLALALQDPGAEAQKLADTHFPGMTQAIAQNIKMQQAAGDTSGAFARELAVVQAGTKGASENLTPLQASLQNLSKAFTTAGSDGHSLSDVLGKSITDSAALAINAIAGVVRGIEALRTRAIEQLQPQAGGVTNPDATGQPVLLGQLQPDGQRAVGISQVNPATAADLGYSAAQINTTAGNLFAGLTYFTQQVTRTGSLAAGSGSYNLGPAGYDANPSAAIGYNTKVGAASTSSLPAAIQAQIEGEVAPALTNLVENAAKAANVSVDEVVKRFEQVVVTESGGQQYGKGIAGSGGFGSSNISSANPLSISERSALSGVGVGADDGSIATANAQQIQATVDQAQKAAGSMGLVATTAAAAKANVDLFTNGLAALKTQGITTGAQVDLFKEALAKSNVEFYNAIPAVAGVVRQINNNIIASNGLATAYTQGDVAVNKVIAHNQAILDLQGKLAPSAAGYGKAVADLTQKHLDEAAALGLIDFNKTLADTQKSTDAQLRINSAWDGSATSLTHLTDVEKARAQVEKEGNLTDEEKARRIDALTSSFDQAAAAAQTFQQQQASVQAISGAFSQAFSTIGNAITQAFVQGQGAAVNWGNIVKSVLAQVIQQVAQLAVLNPVLNSLFGQNNGTLGVGLQTLAQGGGSSSSSGSGSSIGSSLFSGASTASSVSGAFGGPTLGSSLGLTGPGGLLTGTGSSIGSNVSGFLATDTGIGATGLGGIPAEGAISAAQVSASGTAGASIGSLATGIGVGFAAGSLAGGLVAGALNKAPSVNPEVGAATGAVAGAAIGSIIPGIGTVIGGLIGGLIGGGGGGLIGPHKASVFSTSDLFVRNGGIGQSDLIQQGVDGFPQQQVVINQIAALQAFESQNGISATGQTGRVQIGINNPGPGGFQDPTKFNDLNTANTTGQTAFSKFQFGAQDSVENAKISVKSFSTTDELQAWVTAFNTAQTATKNIIDGTTNLAGQFGVTVGSVSTSLAAVNTQFDGADTTIKALLASEYLSTQQTTDLTKAEGDLNTLRAKSIAQINQAAYAQNQTITQGFTARNLTAVATLSGKPADAETAQLYAFDISAQQQRDSLKATEVGMFGDAIVTNKDYLSMVATLEATLGNERLVIQKTFNDQIAAADKAAHDKALTDAGTNVVSLTQYLQKLETGSNSPLSAQEQLTLTRQTFATDRSQIQSGNLSNLSSLTTDADALLASSRAMFGSGAGFNADFKSVIDTISSIANMPVDTLTGAIFTAETKTQTAVLSDGLTTLQGELAAIRLELRQAFGTPAQVAAA